MDEPSRLHDRQTDKARAVRIRDAFSAALAGDERTQRAARRWDRQLEATFRAKKRAEAEAQYTGLCSELGIAESDLTGRPVEGMDIQADGHEFRAILPRALAARIGRAGHKRWGVARHRQGEAKSALDAALMRMGEVLPMVARFLAEDLGAPWAQFAAFALLNDVVVDACDRAGWPLPRGDGGYVFVPSLPARTWTFSTSEGEPVHRARSRLDQFHRDVSAQLARAAEQAKAGGRNPGTKADGLSNAGRWLYERGILKRTVYAIGRDLHQAVTRDRKAHPPFGSCGCQKTVRDALANAESYLKLPPEWRPQAPGN